MDAQQQENFDLSILRILDQNRTRYGLPKHRIASEMGTWGFPGADADVIVERLDYLVQKGLVHEAVKQLSAANRCWVITEAGMTYVDEH